MVLYFLNSALGRLLALRPKVEWGYQEDWGSAFAAESDAKKNCAQKSLS